ncbi:hypothetical protein D3C87_2062460 [compost metagenome]
MGFVNDDALGCGSKELLAVTFALDVIQADDDHRMVVEQAHAMRQIALDAGGGGRGQRNSLKVETSFQFTLPLLDQMRRAQDG